MLNAQAIEQIFQTAEAQAVDFITEYEVETLCADHGREAIEYFAENSRYTATIESVLTWLGY